MIRPDPDLGRKGSEDGKDNRLKFIKLNKNNQIICLTYFNPNKLNNSNFVLESIIFFNF